MRLLFHRGLTFSQVLSPVEDLQREAGPQTSAGRGSQSEERLDTATIVVNHLTNRYHHLINKGGVFILKGKEGQRSAGLKGG